MIQLERACLRLLQYGNRRLKSASLRLTKLTGKSPVPMHPHHLLELRPEHNWYLKYLEPQARVLDVGCANARHTLSVARHGHYVVGFDYDLREIKRGQALLQGEERKNVALLAGDAEAGFPFLEASFDAVLLLDVIEHLVERDAVLGEIHRVLRPEGLLLLSAPNRDTRWKRRLKRAGLFYYSDPDHKVEYTPATLRAEIERNGFLISSDFMPIVLDTPLAGAIDLVGGVSLTFYRRLSNWKVAQARRHPEDSVGWRLVCRKGQR